MTDGVITKMLRTEPQRKLENNLDREHQVEEVLQLWNDSSHDSDFSRLYLHSKWFLHASLQKFLLQKKQFRETAPTPSLKPSATTPSPSLKASTKNDNSSNNFAQNFRIRNLFIWGLELIADISIPPLGMFPTS